MNINGYIIDPQIPAYLALTGSALSTLAGGWLALRASRANEVSARAQEATLQRMIENTRDSAYENLTTQYLSLKGRLPKGFRTRPLSEKLSERETIAAKDMVRLFSKEHRSYTKGNLDEEDWKEFLEGMENFGTCPHGEEICNVMLNDPKSEIREQFRLFYNPFLAEKRAERDRRQVNGHFPAIMKDKSSKEIGTR